MGKWIAFCVLWTLGLVLAYALAVDGSTLFFMGGMWMLACVALKEAIAGYQSSRAKQQEQKP